MAVFSTRKKIRKLLANIPFPPASVTVALGMTAIIWGGVGGSGWLAAEEVYTPTLAQSGFATVEKDSVPASSKTLIEDIQTLKSETESLLSDTGYSMFSFATASSFGFTPRQDPFAPIAPPGGNKVLLAKKTAEESPEAPRYPAKVNAPGDG